MDMALNYMFLSALLIIALLLFFMYVDQYDKRKRAEKIADDLRDLREAELQQYFDETDNDFRSGDMLQ